MHPGLIPNDRLVVPHNGAVLGRDHQPVIRAGDHLSVAPNHALVLQFIVGLLVVLRHGELGHVLDLRRIQVLDRPPPARRHQLTAADHGGGESEEEEKEE